jgi:hypothetical protein
MNRQGILAWALVSAVAMVIGAFGPWLTVGGTYSASGTDISSKYAGFLIGLAVVGATLIFWQRMTSSSGVWALFTGLIGVAVSAYEHHHIASALALTQSFTSIAGWDLGLHVGWGLDLDVVAAASMVVCGIASFFFEPEHHADPAPATRYEPNVPSVPAGWYSDPNDNAMLRYWNGFGWTTQTARPAS